MAVPSSLQFRFKAEKLTSLTAPSQSLFVNNTGSNGGAVQFAVVLEYTGSKLTSGSYAGSTLNPQYQYATLKFIHPENNTSASVYLPFYNEEWWSVMVTRDTAADNVYTLYAKNNIYNIDTGNQIGFEASATCSGSLDWAKFGNAYIPGSGSINLLSKTYTQGSGSFQEVRYFDVVVKEQSFDDFVMNPHSIEGNNLDSSYNDLFLRASLGGELYTGSKSIHPSVGGITPTGSFFLFPTGSTSLFSFTGSYSFVPNREYFHFDEPAVGIKNRVSNKIKKASTSIYGNVLSNQISLQQQYAVSQSYTSDINYVEVGFSPQNEINDDITQQFGYFNIGEYIGDPRQALQSNYLYPDLVTLSNSYFKKYNKSYDLKDYLRLIKFYDNSLFKLINDFSPAKSSVTTGAIIKQHLLERNRQRPAQVSYTQPEYTASVTSLPRDYQTGSIGVPTGGTGGSVDNYLNSPQSWSSSILTQTGLVNQINSSEYEFYNGEYSGSQVTAQLVYNLNLTPLINNASSSRLSTIYQDIDYRIDGYRPINFNLITASLAYKAPVQDSNYTRDSMWSRGRYEGSKLTSAKYNIYTPGDISYGQTAVIDNYSDYIGYFDFIESADPEYPGGGIVNLKYLVHIDGTVIGLTGANQNLTLVESIFKAGAPASATFFGQGYSNTNTVTAVPIVEGGASYRTILVKSGSQSNPASADLAIAFENYPNGYSSGGQDTIYDLIYFATSSINTRILQDSGSAPAYTTGWLSMMLRPSSSVAGICTGFSPQDTQISIWNKYQSKYYTAFIPYEETLFPLQTYDFIRFGLTNPVNITASVDYSFSSYALYRIISSSIGDVDDIPSNLTLESVITGSFSADLPHIAGPIPQGFRIFRRVPDETKVTVSPIPAYLQNGILIPNNFNPNVDPVVLARKVGLIT